jgi:hypothetical protein
MWQRLAILGAGYGFIVLSYAWVWIIAAGVSQYASAERMDRLTKADVKAVLRMMAIWTIAWVVLAVIDSFERG